MTKGKKNYFEREEGRKIIRVRDGHKAKKGRQ